MLVAKKGQMPLNQNDQKNHQMVILNDLHTRGTSCFTSSSPCFTGGIFEGLECPLSTGLAVAKQYHNADVIVTLLITPSTVEFNTN